MGDATKISASQRTLDAARSTSDVRGAERAVANDNRTPAGTLRGNTPTIAIETRIASWYPEADTGPSVDIPVFAEVGKAAQVPGPLVRVFAGTRVLATVRNGLPNDTVTIHGLHDRAAGARPAPPVRLAPGEHRAIDFALETPGTYYYWATTMGRPLTRRFREDAQLSGAIVVDPAGSPRPRGRVFVLGTWSDTTGVANPHWRKRLLMVMNGRSWPHTERLTHIVGDTVHWHVLNPTADIHPMHLHGFYFDVEGRGDGIGDTTYTAANQDKLVTEFGCWFVRRTGRALARWRSGPHTNRRSLLPRGAVGAGAVLLVRGSLRLRKCRRA